MRMPRSIAEITKGRQTTLFLALFDQFIYSFSNLVLQIIIARSTSSEEFGAYSVGAAFFLVTAMIHQTGIIEPMFVFTSQRYIDQMGAYHRRLRVAWSVQFSIMVISVGLIISAVLWYLGSPLLARVIATFSVFSPPVLYLWLMRRMAFLMGRIDVAVLGGMAYALILIGSAAALFMMGQMTLSAGIELSGVAALIGSMVVGIIMKWAPPISMPPSDMLRQHLRYGRWSLGAEAVNWLISNGPILILPIWYGLSASAQFRVLNLIFMPLYQTGAATTSILLRRFASRGNEADRLQTVIPYFLLLFGGAIVYSVVAVHFGSVVAPMLFGPTYSVPRYWLGLMAISVTCSHSVQAFFSALRSREQSYRVLLVNLTVLMILVCMLPLVSLYGVVGLLLAQAAAGGVSLVLASVLVSRGREVVDRHLARTS